MTCLWEDGKLTKLEKRCPYHGGLLIHIMPNAWYCIPSKGWYTGNDGHELEDKDLQ